MGRGCKHRPSFPHLTATHLLLCLPVPNRPWRSMAWGLGPLFNWLKSLKLSIFCIQWSNWVIKLSYFVIMEEIYLHAYLRVSIVKENHFILSMLPLILFIWLNVFCKNLGCNVLVNTCSLSLIIKKMCHNTFLKDAQYHLHSLVSIFLTLQGSCSHKVYYLTTQRELWVLMFKYNFFFTICINFLGLL